MDYSKKKIHSFGKIFGGKNRYARAYIKLFPPAGLFPTYVEPFAGGAGILMNKVKSEKEIISDVDKNVHNVMICLRDYGENVKRILRTRYGGYSEITFKTALADLGTPLNANVIRAAAYIAANRMSRSGLFRDFATSKRLRGGQMGDKNAYENYINDEINLTIARLQGVDILNQCAFQVIKANNKKSTLIYLDPPYLHETRVTKNAYVHEFSEADHIRLLKLITAPSFRATVFLSGYDSPLYREFLSGWKVHSFDRPCDSGQTKVKTKRREIVWENWSTSKLGSSFSRPAQSVESRKSIMSNGH